MRKFNRLQISKKSINLVNSLMAYMLCQEVLGLNIKKMNIDLNNFYIKGHNWFDKGYKKSYCG